jgi:HSP20 family protein
MLTIHSRPHFRNAPVALNGSLFDRLFDEAFFAPDWNPAAASKATRSAGFAVDVSERDQAYELVAELPGFARESIAIDIAGDTVKIIATHQTASTDGDAAKPLRTERRAVTRERTLQFAQALDADKASAKFENGLLTLTLPKLAAANVKRVQIA